MRYNVFTLYENGRRKHYVIDEITNEKIGEYYTNHTRAKKACRALNKALKKVEKKNEDRIVRHG